MKIAVLKETVEAEKRVAMIPDSVKRLVKRNIQVTIQSGAGEAAGFTDTDYEKQGGTIATAADLASADAFVKVLPPTLAEVDNLPDGKTLISIIHPMTRHDLVHKLAAKKITAFGMDVIPRTTLAQSMDVLSSMSTITGYKAVLMAANSINKFFPMLMTAAGTLAPTRVMVLGAGVAGLMACATAKRLGAVVEATDVRPEVREQVKSVGAKFLAVKSDESGAGEGGYAKEMSDDYKQKQAEMIARHIAKADVVIPTALIPGRKAPILITEAHVKSMKTGSVIVDLAAEMGGNCELTEMDKDVVKHGVLIIGNSNLPSTMSCHASQMFSKNVERFISHLTDENGFKMDMNDEITKGSLVTRNGEVMHAMTKKLMAQGDNNG
ncbi:MAG: Re/Si-specific NAD(P)(+) transhydrogenase subunit alpha [Deltaproteobacteria bacterium]|nr:Re/Si-specific NAD(P)(+) transhydrogenase subunit alpha [Deltaproteobacteria bacterium]